MKYTRKFFIALGVIYLVQISNSFGTHQMSSTVNQNSKAIVTVLVSCWGVGDAEITKKPLNGKISIRVAREVVDEQKLKTSTNFPCSGKVGDHLYIYYSPKKNYVGHDSFELMWILNDGSTYSKIYDIDVIQIEPSADNSKTRTKTNKIDNLTLRELCSRYLNLNSSETSKDGTFVSIEKRIKQLGISKKECTTLLESSKN